MAKTVALVPSYQPDAHLIEVLESLSKLGMEEVVVDDGSGMGYRPLFDLAPAGTTLISYVNNCGKGVALKVGLKYIQEQSVKTDLKILLRTVVTVLRRDGAV